MIFFIKIYFEGTFLRCLVEEDAQNMIEQVHEEQSGDHSNK